MTHQGFIEMKIEGRGLAMIFVGLFFYLIFWLAAMILVAVLFPRKGRRDH